MTNYEADNSSSLPQSTIAGHSWNWLRERLPVEGVAQFGRWMDEQLSELETSYSSMITPRSQKRDLRHEFAASKRSQSESQ